MRRFVRALCAMAPATFECYGRALIVRGGEADVVEGSPPAKTS